MSNGKVYLMKNYLSSRNLFKLWDFVVYLIQHRKLKEGYWDVER